MFLQMVKSLPDKNALFTHDDKTVGKYLLKLWYNTFLSHMVFIQQLTSLFSSLKVFLGKPFNLFTKNLPQELNSDIQKSKKHDYSHKSSASIKLSQLKSATI